jgi:gamma-glutamyltranspeptidase / glutathione hydrolase
VQKFNIVATVLGLGLILSASTAWSQAVPSDGLCGRTGEPAFCKAVRGARAEGWSAQSRSEVMAQHGMVVTSQPLAAQAGLQILKGGGTRSMPLSRRPRY